MRLRPHHSLCIRFFIGEGYSGEFVRGMTETIRMLNTENPLLFLSRECDIICRFCPNNNGGVCNADSKVSAIDMRCLEQLGLQFGDRIHWNDLYESAFCRIIKEGRLKVVCQSCQWSEICNNNSF